MPLRVIIESPYSGDIKRNLIYLRRCIKDSLDRGEAPFASHGFYTQYLDDNNEIQRQLGIHCGYAWLEVAEIQAFYIDYGISDGMIEAHYQTEYLTRRPLIEFRRIGQNPTEESQ